MLRGKADEFNRVIYFQILLKVSVVLRLKNHLLKIRYPEHLGLEKDIKKAGK